MATTTKTCARCKRTRASTEFKAAKRSKDGLHSWCRDCCALYDKERGLKRRTHDKPGRPPKQIIDGKMACGTCGEVKPAADFCKDATTPTGYRARCKACDSTTAKGFYARHRPERIANAAAWNKANGPRRWLTKKADKQQLLADYLRSRLWKAVQAQLINKPDAGRGASAVRDLGCTIGELMVHLESKFQPGMTWDNYGEWHIDHVRPLASFDLTDSEQCKRACHFTNLQPLWGPDNLAKGAKL
ncbi:conserved hypothetical protein [Virus Rctr197k]|nr:conserved hypothetical protein [Virus Rctr197k]